MPESEPTNWELMRLLKQMQTDQRDMAASMLTAAIFEVHQRGMDRRFAELEKDLNKETEARIKGDEALNGKITDRDRFKRGVYAAVALAILTALLSFTASLASTGVT